LLCQAAIAAKEEFAETSANCGLAVIDFQEFGKNAFKKWKISPDAAAQLAFHTAYYSLHGKMPTVSINSVCRSHVTRLPSAAVLSMLVLMQLLVCSGLSHATSTYCRGVASVLMRVLSNRLQLLLLVI
jgi:Choline/Carnitine o-acyltransferase